MVIDCDDGLDVGLMVDSSNDEYMKFIAVKFIVVLLFTMMIVVIIMIVMIVIIIMIMMVMMIYGGS